MKKKKINTKTFREEFFGAIIGFALFFLIWYLLTTYTPLKRMLPGPIPVLSLFFHFCVNKIGRYYTMPMHALISLKRILVGYTAAVVLGIICGVLMGINKTFRAFFQPLFEMIRPIPTLAWIPLALVWFGSGEMAKYFIVFYGAFANIVINTFAGITSVDPVLIGAAKMLGAKDNQMLRSVIFPSAVPYIFSGMQIALSSSLMGVIASEMVKANEGLGWMIFAAQETGNTTQILAAMIAIAIIGFTISTSMRAIEKRLCSWNVQKK